MLLALCGALLHYFNSVAPGVINSDRRLKEAANALMARVQIKDGHVTLDASSAGQPPLPAPDSIKYALRDSQGHLLSGDAQIPAVPMMSANAQLFAMAQIDARSLRTLTTRFDTRGGVIIITVADVRMINEPAARYGFMSTLLWDFVQLDVTLVLVWVGIQLGLRPVKRLRDEIAQRSPLDLRPIVESSVPREIAPVVVTLNRLQAQLDVLVGEPAAQPVRNRLLTLQEGVRQLAHSANQLLSLARADPAANLAAKNQPVELNAIVGEVAARFFDRALQSNIDLGVEVDPVSIVADPSLLDDLLSNLVDNALKYTPAGGSVTVSAGLCNGSAYLAVEDTGPGIAEAERQRVRQRFYRQPNSPGHGSGLGLAIVDEIAQLYGASMTIGPAAGGRGTKVLVQFP